MKRLHHPGTPCDIESKDIKSATIKDKDIEVVNCSQGFALFIKRDSFWASEKELSSIQGDNSVRFFCNKGNISDGGWFFYSPIDLEVCLTKKCNQRCLHCWNYSGEGKDIDFNRLKKIIGEFRSKGGQVLKLSGGEPFCYGPIRDFLFFSKEKGIPNVEMTTNGGFLEDLKKCKGLIDKLNVSIHGHDKKIHDEITRTKGSFEGTLKTLDYLKESRLESEIYFTVMKGNVDSIIPMQKLCEKYNSKIRFSLLRPLGRGKNLDNGQNLDVEEIRRLVCQIDERFLQKSELYPRGYDKDIDSSKFYGCSAFRKSMYIDNDGDVFPCNLIKKSFGNVHEQTLKEIWESREACEFRSKTLCDCLNTCNVTCSGKCKAKLYI